MSSVLMRDSDRAEQSGRPANKHAIIIENSYIVNRLSTISAQYIKENMQTAEKVKSGIVALVGPPNVGKSTLLNRLLGQKISIVSPKPQTTRNRILGIVNGPDHQVVLLDTPGIHEARSPLNQEMVKIALDTLAEVDGILFMTDVTLPPPSPSRNPAEVLAGRSQPVLLVLNKIDLVAKEKLLPILAAYQALMPFRAIIPISAKSGDGADLLLREVIDLLPEGPRLYPEDIPTDASERFITAEIIREKIFLQTRQEVPYSTAVVIDRFHDDGRLATIDATIIVEHPSQKGIVIGKKGMMLKAIGSAARIDIEQLLDRKVLLKLFVKVEKEWTRNPRLLRELGFQS